MRTLSFSRWDPGVFMPSPAEVRHQSALYIIAGVANSEAAPDQTGDAFGGPDGGVESMGGRSLRQQDRESRQFVASQLRAGTTSLRAAAQPFVSAQTIPRSPSLYGLYADAEGACDA